MPYEIWGPWIVHNGDKVVRERLIGRYIQTIGFCGCVKEGTVTPCPPDYGCFFDWSLNSPCNVRTYRIRETLEPASESFIRSLKTKEPV